MKENGKFYYAFHYTEFNWRPTLVFVTCFLNVVHLLAPVMVKQITGYFTVLDAVDENRSRRNRQQPRLSYPRYPRWKRHQAVPQGRGEGKLVCMKKHEMRAGSLLGFCARDLYEQGSYKAKQAFALALLHHAMCYQLVPQQLEMVGIAFNKSRYRFYSFNHHSEFVDRTKLIKATALRSSQQDFL